MSVPNRAEHPNRIMGDHVTPAAQHAANAVKAKETNSAGGSKWQKPASEEAARLSNTSGHGSPDTKAVVWTQGGKGSRYEGTHVSPRNDKDGSGITLHTTSGPMKFKDTEVHEVHYVKSES